MITVVLLSPQTPANIGFIARAMANFDLNKLIIINPFCNHITDESVKISKHGINVLKNAVIKEYDYINILKNNFDSIIGTTSVLGTDYNISRTPLIPKELAPKIGLQNVAVILGNEGTGLNNEEIKKCDFIVSIPSSKKYPALNISHAAAILFYELYAEFGRNKIDSHIKPASQKEKSIIMDKFSNILNNIEFSTDEKKQTQLIVWKKIFEKSMMSKREAYSVIGLLRKLEELTIS